MKRSEMVNLWMERNGGGGGVVVPKGSCLNRFLRSYFMEQNYALRAGSSLASLHLRRTRRTHPLIQEIHRICESCG